MKNMLIKVLSVVMALTMIMGACVTTIAAADIVNHVHDYEKVGHVDATCITPGYDVYECACGDAKTVATDAKLTVCVGPFEKVTEVTAPNCTEPGYLPYERCTLCGNGDKQVDPANPKPLGHKAELVIEDPACGVNGKIYDKCAVCEKILTVYANIEDCIGSGRLDPEENPGVKPNVHYCTIAGHSLANYVYEVVQAPTCTEPGYADYRCPVANCESKVTVKIEAMGHLWWSVNTPFPGAQDSDFAWDENKSYAFMYTAPKCEDTGFRVYACWYCDLVADKDHPEVVEIANKDIKARDGALTDANRAGVIAATGHAPRYMCCNGVVGEGHVFVNGEHAVTEEHENCACIVGYRTNAGSELSGKAQFLYQEPTCYQDGHAWWHCVNETCDYGTDVKGNPTHKVDFEVVENDGAHEWIVNANGDYVYKYSITYTAANGSKYDLVARNTTLAGAIVELKVAFKNATGLDYYPCEISIYGGYECKWCGEVKRLEAQSAPATGHDWEIINRVTDAQLPICHPDSVNYHTSKCKVCGVKETSKNYVYEHVLRYKCNNPTCKSADPANADTGRTDVWADCRDCTHEGRVLTCVRGCDQKCVEDANGALQVSVDAKYTEHNFVITDEKVAHHTLTGYGDIYVTCQLSTKYVYECDHANCDVETIDYRKEDVTKVGGAVYDDANNNGVWDLGESVSRCNLDKIALSYDKNSLEYAIAHQPEDKNNNIEGIVYIAPTCVTDGSISGFCSWCSENIDMVLPKSEEFHNWQVKTAKVAATCMAEGSETLYECVVNGCNAEKGGEAIPKDYTNHVAGCTRSAEPVKYRPASCTIAYAHVYQWSTCKWFEEVEVGQVDPSNHVYYEYDETTFAITNVISRLETVELFNANCTDMGRHGFTFCLDCFYIVDVDLEDCIYDDCTHGCADDAALAIKDKNNNTQTINNLCAGIHCTTHTVLAALEEDLVEVVNNVNVMQSIVDAIDEEATYKANNNNAPYNKRGANITAAAVAKYYEVNNRLTGYDTYKFNEETEKYEKTGKVELNVGAAIADDVDGTIFDIAPLGHNFWFDTTATVASGNILRVVLKETCTTPGHEWKIACSRECCITDNDDGSKTYETIHEALNGETILPHGLDKIYRNDTEIPPTCTTGGELKGLFCEDCAAWEGKTDAQLKAEHIQKCAICRGPDYLVGAKGHKPIIHATTVNAWNCGQYALQIYKCDRCDDMSCWYGTNYRPATGLHDTTGTEQTVEPECETEGYKYINCKVCRNKVITERIPATGHSHDGDYISFSCVNDEYLIYKGTKCDFCDRIVTVTNDLNRDVICGVQNAGIQHNWIETTSVGGCLVNGGTMLVCADCGVTKIDSVHAYDEVTGICDCGAKIEDAYEAPAHGHHEYGTTVEFVPGTPEKVGTWTWICRRCGEVITEAVYYAREIEFTLTVAPYVPGVESETLKFVNGGYIELVLSVSSETLTFNTISHVLDFDSSLFEFVSAEYLYEFGQHYYKANENSVSTSVWYNFADTTTVDGENIDLFKFIFKLAPGVKEFDASDIGHLASKIAVKSDDVTYTPTVVDITDNDDETLIPEEIEVNLMGDVYTDGKYDANDIKIFSDIILELGNCTGEEDECEHPELHVYNNVADINSDGVTDMEDWMAILNFVHTEQTVADYYAMFGYDLYAMIEEFECFDYSKDGFINELDEKIFEEYVLSDIEEPYAWADAVDNEFGDFTSVLEDADEDLRPTPRS